MRRSLIGVLLIVEVVAFLAAAYGVPRLLSGSCTSLGRSLTVPAGAQCRGGALAIGGDLVVRGSVEGPAVALWGNVWVEGRINGDVVSIGGAGTVLRGAWIGGDLTVLGGHLRQEAGAGVAGSVLEIGWALRPARGGIDRQVAPIGQRLIGAAVAGAVLVGLGPVWGLGLRTVWPRRTQAVTAALRHAWEVSLGLGLAATLLLAGLAPLLSWLLLGPVVGLPILVLFWLLVLLVYFVGVVITGLALGEWVAKPAPAWGQSLIGLAGLTGVILFSALWKPAWGMLILSLSASAGLGALFLSRAGTRERET